MQQNNFKSIIIDGDSDYLSVSKILQSDPKKKRFYQSRAAQRKKEGLDSDTAATGRHRGESLHQVLSDYLLTGEGDCSPIYLDYWDSLYKFISPLNIKPIWSEGPLLPEHSHLTSGDTSLVWSTKHKYCGRPDLIASIEGVNAVVEIKTSRSEYSKVFDYRKFMTYSSYYNYSYASMQVAAYASAWTERTKQPIDCGIVINVMPGKVQFFDVQYPEMQLRFKNFKKLLRDYRKTFA